MSLTWDRILRAHHVQFLDLAVSPDDSCVLATLGDVDLPYEEYSVDIMRRVVTRLDLTTGDATQLTQAEEDAHTPAWSPDGETIAYLSRAGGQTEVWTMTKDGTSRRQLTHEEFPARNPYQDSSLWWTPDGRKLVYTVVPNGSRRALVDELAKAQPEHGPTVYTPDVAQRAEEWVREHLESQLRIVDIATGEDDLVKSYRGQEVEALCLWREKAAVLVAAGATLEEVDLVPSPKWLWHVGDKTGDTRVLYRGPLGLLQPAGGVLRMALMRDDGIAAGSIREGRFVEERAAETGMPGLILRAWGTDGSCLYGVLHRGVMNQLVRVDLGSGRVDCLVVAGTPIPAPQTVQDRAGIRALAKTKAIVFACESPTEPVELWQASEGGPLAKLTQLNIAVSPDELPAVSVVRYDSDGWSIEALLVEPRSPRPPAGWPTLTYLHGGPERCVEASFSELISARAQSAAYWLASKGYAVLLPNFRGSSGYGDAFKAQIADYQLLRRPFADVMAGLDFLAERGTADPDRLGLYGSSFGGWLTAWAISQTGRFKGAVVALGYYDLLYRDRVSGRAFHSLTPNRLGTADPMAMWSAPEVYTHLSPMEHVAKVRTPVLLIETAAEAKSQLGGGRAFCNGLWAQGVESYLVRYPEAFHQGGWTDEYKTDYANRLTAWFDHCLLGTPLPGWFLEACAFAGV